MMQPMEITQIQRELSDLQNEIDSVKIHLAKLEQQKQNLKIELEVTKKRIQKSGIKY